MIWQSERSIGDIMGQRGPARLLAALMLMMSALAAVPARAADISVDTGDSLPIISITGEIRSGDDVTFRRVASRHNRAIVLLNGPGGQLTTALAIGRIINERGYSTAAAPGTCSSACALIWLAGSRRAAFSTARIGFHAGYRIDGGESMEDGVANAIIGRYMTQLNFPESAIIFATSAGPQEMAWLNLDQPGAHGITYDIIEDPEAGNVQARQAGQSGTLSTPAVAPRGSPRPAPRERAPTVRLPERSPPATGRTGPLPTPGRWTFMGRGNVYGVSTVSPARSDAVLMYACTDRTTCLMGLTLAAQCVPGDRYTLGVELDGVDRDVEAECDQRGRILYLDEPIAQFNAMLSARTMTVIVEGARSGTNRIPFTLTDLPQRWREASVNR
jgi:hypothetical protein